MTIRYLGKKPSRSPAPLVAAVFAQARQDFGFVPEPLRLHAPVPPVLAAAWGSLREGVLAAGRVPRGVKEAVAASISQLNRCPYCVDVHSSLLHASAGAAVGTGRRASAASATPATSSTPSEVAAATDRPGMPAAPGAASREAAWSLRRQGPDAIADPSLRAAARWAAATRTPGAAILAAPPFGDGEVPEMIATAACFHYINRLVTVFLGVSPFPGPARLLGGALVLLTSAHFAPQLRRTLAPGASLAFLSPAAAPLPPDLGWAAARPEIAAPFASLAVAVEAEAGELLGDGAAAVRARLAAWRGEDPPLAAAWVDEALAGVEPGARPSARLALLTALAPHRVDAAEVAAFRARHPGDRPLVAVTTWASFAAARRLTGWLWSGGGPAGTA